MRPATLLALVVLFVSCGNVEAKKNNANNANNQNNFNSLNNQNNANNQNNGGGESLDLSLYDAACSFDSDCQLITHQSRCPSCPPCTGNAALSIAGAAEYATDFAALPECTPSNNGGPCPGAACLPARAACVDDVCQVAELVEIYSGSFDVSCQTAEDCVPVFEGDVCDICGCPNAAINSDDAETYNTTFGERRELAMCNQNPGITCDCAFPNVICSDANTCEVE